MSSAVEVVDVCRVRGQKGLVLPIQGEIAVTGCREKDPAITRVHESNFPGALQPARFSIHQFADKIIQNLDLVLATRQDSGRSCGGEYFLAVGSGEHSSDFVSTPRNIGDWKLNGSF